jgi:hypothetical protein
MMPCATGRSWLNVYGRFPLCARVRLGVMARPVPTTRPSRRHVGERGRLPAGADRLQTGRRKPPRTTHPAQRLVHTT